MMDKCTCDIPKNVRNAKRISKAAGIESERESEGRHRDKLVTLWARMREDGTGEYSVFRNLSVR